jgi:hypothetical protein
LCDFGLLEYEDEANAIAKVLRWRWHPVFRRETVRWSLEERGRTCRRQE